MTPLDPPLRVGIIGSNWGRIHIGSFRAAGAEIVALCGRDRSKTADIARHEGIPVATTSVKELCEGVEIVVVAGPDGLHREHVLCALEAGRHVLCEKPLTRTAQDADELELAARSAAARGIICAVSFAYRHLPVMRGLYDWMSRHEPPRWLSVTVRNSFAGAEGVNFLTQGPIMGLSGDFGAASHILDVALWMMRGEPRWVEAVMMGRPAHSLALHIGLNTGGLIAVTHFAVPEPGIAGHWHIVGDTWEGRVAGGYAPPLGGWRIGPAQVFTGQTWDQVAPEMAPQQGQPEPWFRANIGVARAFVEAVRQKKPAADHLADFRQGAVIQRVFAAAMESEIHKRRVDLPQVESKNKGSVRT